MPAMVIDSPSDLGIILDDEKRDHIMTLFYFKFFSKLVPCYVTVKRKSGF